MLYKVLLMVLIEIFSCVVLLWLIMMFWCRLFFFMLELMLWNIGFFVNVFINCGSYSCSLFRLLFCSDIWYCVFWLLLLLLLGRF